LRHSIDEAKPKIPATKNSETAKAKSKLEIFRDKSRVTDLTEVTDF